MQNVPFALKEANLNLKELFLPDAGYSVYDLDIQNAEVRMLTAYSRDENLIKIFNENKDMHSMTAAAISEYSYEDLKAHKEDKDSDQYRKRQLGKKVRNWPSITPVNCWNIPRGQSAAKLCTFVH